MHISRFDEIKKKFRKQFFILPFLVPLIFSIRPRSFIAHDEGYYILQARATLLVIGCSDIIIGIDRQLVFNG